MDTVKGIATESLGRRKDAILHNEKEGLNQRTNRGARESESESKSGSIKYCTSGRGYAAPCMLGSTGDLEQ